MFLLVDDLYITAKVRHHNVSIHITGLRVMGITSCSIL